MRALSSQSPPKVPCCQPYSASERKEKDKYRLTCTRAKPYFPFSFVVSSIRPMRSITALTRRLSLVSTPCKRTSVLRSDSSGYRFAYLDFSSLQTEVRPSILWRTLNASLPPKVVRQANRYLPLVDIVMTALSRW